MKTVESTYGMTKARAIGKKCRAIIEITKTP
jgi:hypothetical protein